MLSTDFVGDSIETLDSNKLSYWIAEITNYLLKDLATKHAWISVPSMECMWVTSMAMRYVHSNSVWT